MLLKWLTMYDFVVIDDFGRETYTDKRVELAFRVVDTLMNEKVTVSISANQEMIEKIESIKGMNATLDRLREMCPHKIFFKNNSRRGIDSP